MGKVRSSITDLATSFGEVAVDAMMEQGVLRDIPILGSAVGIARASRGVRDALFLTKLQGVIENFEGLSDADKQEMRTRLERDEERERIGQQLVFVLERADDLNKAKLIGKCLKVYLEGKIDSDMLLRFWHAIDRCFLNDLKYLHLYLFASMIHGEEVGVLVSAGLLVNTKDNPSDMMELTSKRPRYKLSRVGRMFWDLIMSGE